MFKIRYISLYLSVLIVIGFFFIKEDVIFESIFLMILGVVAFSAGIATNLYAIIELDDYKIIKGNKQKEKVHTLSFSILVFFFVLSIIYFIDYFFVVSFLSFLILYALMAFIIVVGLVQYFIDYIIINNDGFESRYLINLKKVDIKYDDIKEIRFGSLMNVITVKTESKTAYIDVTIKGVEVLLNELTARTPIEIHKDAFEGLRKYYKSYLFTKNLLLLRYFDDEETKNEEKSN